MLLVQDSPMRLFGTSVAESQRHERGIVLSAHREISGEALARFQSFDERWHDLVNVTDDAEVCDAENRGL